MFNGMFGPMRNDNCCGHDNDRGENNNCWWLILVALFFCFCGCGNDRKWKLMIKPCTLIPILLLAFCCGGIKFDRH